MKTYFIVDNKKEELAQNKSKVDLSKIKSKYIVNTY